MLRSRKLALAGAAAVALGLVAWLLTGLLDGPWGMVPGGPFHGRDESCPRDFSFAAETAEIEVEVASGRSMTIWSVVRHGTLYLSADFLTPWKGWPHTLAADPRLRLRLDGRVFRCRAERVDDPETIDALRREAARKYDLEPDGWAARVEVWWFRVAPRGD